MPLRLSAQAQGLVNVSGGLTLTFPTVKMDRTWTGTVQVLGGTSAEQLTAEVGSNPWGTWTADTPSTPIQAFGSEQLVVTGTGFTPGAHITAYWIGADYSTKDEQYPIIGPTSPFSAVVTPVVGAALNFQHNDVAVATEPTIDFEDAAQIAWTLTDDPPNTRVKVTPIMAQDGATPGQYWRWSGSAWVPATIALGDLPGIPLSKLTQSGAGTGQVAEWNGSAWVPTTLPTSSLTLLSGAIGSDAVLNNSGGGTPLITKVFDTSSLGVGTWLVTMGALLTSVAATSAFDLEMAVDSATATITGLASTTIELASSNLYSAAVVQAQVVVTGAGTLELQVRVPAFTSLTAKAATPAAGYTQATGWTALQIA